jgi:hypothetical protein
LLDSDHWENSILVPARDSRKSLRRTGNMGAGSNDRIRVLVSCCYPAGGSDEGAEN